MRKRFFFEPNHLFPLNKFWIIRAKRWDYLWSQTIVFIESEIDLFRLLQKIHICSNWIKFMKSKEASACTKAEITSFAMLRIYILAIRCAIFYVPSGTNWANFHFGFSNITHRSCNFGHSRCIYALFTALRKHESPFPFEFSNSATHRAPVRASERLNAFRRAIDSQLSYIAGGKKI